MALHPTGLGKGLDALIRETQEARDSGGVKSLPIDNIFPNPLQPRRTFSEKALEELAASIKSQGLLQPLLVRPLGPGKPEKYEIVAGERRWRASKMAGLTEVPVMVRAFSAQETLAAALIENLQREDLNPLEEALGLQALKEEFGLSQEDIALKLGKSRSAIANSLRLLSLPEAMRPLLAEGKLSAGHARALLSITEPVSQEYLKNLILENRLSVREAEGLASGWKESGRFELAGLVGEPLSTDRLHSQGEGDAAQAEEAPSPPADKKAGEESEARKSRPQSARILEIQNRIGQIFQVPVRVTGKEDKGRISLAYNSREELEAFLKRLSRMVLEGEQRTALPGKERAALAGSRSEALQGTAREVLTDAGHPPLQGSDNPALQGAGHAMLEGTGQQAIPGDGHPEETTATSPAGGPEDADKREMDS